MREKPVRLYEVDQLKPEKDISAQPGKDVVLCTETVDSLSFCLYPLSNEGGENMQSHALADRGDPTYVLPERIVEYLAAPRKPGLKESPPTFSMEQQEIEKTLIDKVKGAGRSCIGFWGEVPLISFFPLYPGQRAHTFESQEDSPGQSARLEGVQTLSKDARRKQLAYIGWLITNQKFVAEADALFGEWKTPDFASRFPVYRSRCYIPPNEADDKEELMAKLDLGKIISDLKSGKIDKSINGLEKLQDHIKKCTERTRSRHGDDEGKAIDDFLNRWCLSRMGTPTLPCPIMYYYGSGPSSLFLSGLGLMIRNGIENYVESAQLLYLPGYYHLSGDDPLLYEIKTEQARLLDQAGKAEPNDSWPITKIGEFANYALIWYVYGIFKSRYPEVLENDESRGHLYRAIASFIDQHKTDSVDAGARSDLDKPMEDKSDLVKRYINKIKKRLGTIS